MFCVELPLDNNKSGKKIKEKVIGKTGNHSIHIQWAQKFDERKNTHPSYIHVSLYIGRVVYVHCTAFANSMVYRWLT